MATLKSCSGPYQRDTRSTGGIMLELSACLGLVWLYSVIYYFIKAGVNYGIKTILMMIISIAVTNVVDIITALLMHKKGQNIGLEIKDKLAHNYSYVTAIIFTLTLPVWCPYYVLIVGSIFATAIKNCFGGFGKNVFNPAVIARIFVGVSFASQIGFNVSGLDAVGGATLTTLINDSTNWIVTSGSIIPAGYNLFDVLFGNYYGALGETCTVLLFVLGIYLSIRRVINWRTPTFMVGLGYIITLIVALVLNIPNPFEYALVHISVGGFMFGAVFMLTDPVTGPTSQFGKCISAVFTAMMIMVIRLSGTSNYPEGVVFAIALSNMIAPLIDYLCIGRNNHKNSIKYAILGGLIVAAIGLNVAVAYNANKNVVATIDTNITEVVEIKEDSSLLHYEEGGLK